MSNKWQKLWYIDVRPRHQPISSIDWWKIYEKLRFSKEKIILCDIDVNKISNIREFEDDLRNIESRLVHSDLNDLLEKFMFLTRQYIKYNYTFIDPVTVFYHPRLEQNVLHPGTKRALIQKLFGKTSIIKAWYLSTHGVKLDIHKEIEEIDPGTIPAAEFWCILESNSAIPQWKTSSAGYRPEALLELKQKINRQLLSERHYCNLEGFMPGLFKHSKEMATRKLTFKSKSKVTDEIKIKALIMLFLNDTYEDDEIVIK